MGTARLSSQTDSFIVLCWATHYAQGLWYVHREKLCRSVKALSHRCTQMFLAKEIYALPQNTNSSGLCGRNHHTKTVSEQQGDEASRSEGSLLLPHEWDLMERIEQNLDIGFSDDSVLILHLVILVVETMFFFWTKQLEHLKIHRAGALMYMTVG